MKTRTILSALFVACIAIFLNSCQKNTPFVDPTGKISGYLVSYEQTTQQQADKALNAVLSTIDDYGFIGTARQVVTSAINNLLGSNFSGARWQMKIYTIVYNTVDAQGRRIQLSGDVAYIDDTNEGSTRELSAVSIFNTMFNMDDVDNLYYNSTKLYETTVLPLRSFHNNLVVFPLFQGAGNDKGVHKFTPMEYGLKARQSIDCAMAALQLIQVLPRISMEEGYGLENMGVSNGASTAVAIHYLLENGGVSDRVASSLNLLGTYAGEGTYTPSTHILNILGNKISSSSGIYDELPFNSLAILQGMMDSHPDIFSQYGVQEVRDYFSDDVLQIKIPYNGEKIDLIDYMNTGNLSPLEEDLYFSPNGLDISNMFSSDLFKSSGTLNYNSALVKAVYDASTQNELYFSDWLPVANMTIVHSKADEVSTLTSAQNMYENLSGNGYNKSVTFSSLYYMDHVTSSAYQLLANISKKHPCPID